MNLDLWKKKGTYFSFGKHRIFFIDEGAGEPLLLIHGFPTSSWDWSSLFPLLKKHYRLITLDMLGFGFSDKPQKHSYSIAEQATLIESLLGHLKLSNVHIMAHDYGDTVTQELIARQLDQQLPFQIQSVCFLNGGLFPEVHQPLLIQKLLMSPIGKWISLFFNQKKLTQNFNRIFAPDTRPTPSEMNDFWRVLSYNNGNKVFHLLILYMEERRTYRARWVGGLQQTKVPLRLIDGLFDPISGKHMLERYKVLVPNPDTIGLENCGHFPLIEMPEAVHRYYIDFRQKLNSAST